MLSDIRLFSIKSPISLRRDLLFTLREKCRLDNHWTPLARDPRLVLNYEDWDAGVVPVHVTCLVRFSRTRPSNWIAADLRCL